MTPGSACTLCCSASLESIIFIIITSVLFLMVCITFCVNCYRQTPASPESPEETETSSSVPPPKTQHVWSATRYPDKQELSNVTLDPAARRHHARSHTVGQCQPPKTNFHSRAESHGYFSKATMPTLSNRTIWTTETPPAYPQTPDFTPLTDHAGAPGGEEHLYECVDMTRQRKSPQSPGCDEAPEDQWQMGRPCQAVTGLAECAANHMDPPTTATDRGRAVEAGLPFQPLPAVQNGRCLSDREGESIYATVNWKNKRWKNRESPLTQDTGKLGKDDPAEVAAPQVPEKMFE
ncbi:uncharacterized protein LOC143523205 [Brachyhypopomus gauderio]|uniref:uncharacterized protein LOC143523205 n=1 Tax=Brachyhypopomus gauderio TaxID=698409 RepID=UPI0040423AF1